jgi:SAM-dependent methyltransferase
MPRIFTPEYWRDRLERALRSGRNCLHHSIYVCPVDRWFRLENKHRAILNRVIHPKASVIDCGCSYGRILGLLTPQWESKYLGVDLSPDFIELANRLYSNRPKDAQQFILGDLRDLHDQQYKEFDWAIISSVRLQVKREAGSEEWWKIEREIRRVAKRLLYLEYDERDEGSVE